MTSLAIHKPTFSKLVVAGAAAMAAAVLVNLAVLFILRPLLGLNPEFAPFNPVTITFITILYTFVGWLVYLVVNRFAKNPARIYVIIATLALLLSFIPNLAAVSNPASFPTPGAPGTARDFAVLMVFHVTAFAAFVGVLLRMVKR